MKKRFFSLMLALLIFLSSGNSVFASDAEAMNSQKSVNAGCGNTGLIDTNNSLWMWGDNDAGQLGNGGGGNAKCEGGWYYQTLPIKVLNKVVCVSSSGKHTAAIKTDGTLWTWGENYYGQLGNGTNTDSLVPQKILDNVVSVSCGGSSVSSPFTAALKSDGSLWTWGANDRGQLGTGIPKDSNVPVKILDNVASVECGVFNMAVIKTDGSLWMWGDNYYGQLGNGINGNLNWSPNAVVQAVPVKVLDNVKAVSIGWGQIAVIKNDNSLWTWGDNFYGQLGNGYYGDRINGEVTDSLIPIKIMDDVAQVSCGYSHTAVIKKDGSLWMWGDNQYGQLGNAYYGDRTVNYGHGDILILTTPTKIMDNVKFVDCGSDHTIVISEDSSIMTCGSNANGELGNGGGYDQVDNNGTPIQPHFVKLSGLTPRISLPTAFYDVAENAYYIDAVKWAIDESITQGTSKNTFSPNQICTTSEILTFLWKSEKSPEPTIGNPFSNVAKNSYYYKAAIWAYEKGLVTGSEFDAKEPCTRSMTVNYLWKLKGCPSADASSFKDIPNNAPYADAVNWAVNEKITSGTNNSTFSPNSTCTRGQIVTFLYRDFVKN